ncbi:MAG TPA: DUF547 domain-containing protein [Thermoanaerobaculia bacterium]|nr:DUF547 domain-containing protein [Thermoanaerobaculia bacterium]
MPSSFIVHRSSFIVLLLLATSASAQLTEWTRILSTYTNPTHGVDYKSLKARDAKTVQAIRQQLARVNAAKLDRKSQLAHWINVYNVNTVATILEHYPVDSIRDISTDPIIRLNVFKKPRVPVGGDKLSLDQIENEKIREGFKDPRIHFAINCAAKSCPPLRTDAYAGAKIDAQLDEQARAFLARTRFERDGDELTIHVTKIMDWFSDDFEKWGGGKAAFIRRYVSADKQRMIDQAKKIELEYDDYDWDLNDWKR